VIGAATDTQYEVGAVNEKATLSTEITAGELAAGQPGSLTLTITNGGPQPAYRVIAKLQSSVAALHGCQISFGRIDPGRTKVRKQVIALPPGQDDRSALVVAQVSYFNGDPLEARRRFDIKPGPPGSARPPVTAAAGTRVEPPRTATGGNQVELPRGLTVACKLAAAEVGPGERVRLECELRNLGSEPLAQVGLKVSVGGVDSENQAPKSLPGAGSVKLELVGLAAQKVKQGDKLPVIVRATAQGVPRAEQILSVAIGSQATRCKARLTRDEYKVKQKRLQAALDSGSLTQKELDKYEAELVSCLQ
jgi:hypothetical protein